MSLRRCRALFAASLFVLLSACGSGGSGGVDAPSSPVLESPPTSAATLSQSPAEATEAVKAVIAGASAIAGQEWGPGSSFLPFGNPYAASAGIDGWAHGGTRGNAREQALAVTTLACTDVFAPPCSGSLTLETNIHAYASTTPAGSYMAFGFNALQGNFAGESLSLQGTLRVDFLTSLDEAATSVANARFLVSSANLSGSTDGEPYGPDNSIKLIEFDSLGKAQVTTGGMAFSDLAAILFI